MLVCSITWPGVKMKVIIEDLGSHVQNPLCATIKAPGLARQLLLLSDLLVYLLLLNNNFFLA